MRRIYTRIVWDSKTLQVIERDSYVYHGPVDEMKKKQPTGMIGGIQNQAQQQQAGGQANITAGTNLTESAVNNPTSSPLYKALYNTEAGGMSKAYDAAAANTRANARTAGFGYQQPAEQGAESQLRSQEASSLGQLPGQVEQQTVPQELQAGQSLAQTGLGQEGQGNQYMTQGAVPLEEQYQNYALNYTPLWQRIAGGVAGMIPGGGGLAGALANA